MQSPLPTSPFGPRSLTLGMLATQAQAAACPTDSKVGKYDLLNILADAWPLLRLPGRGLTLLRALLSFHPGNDLMASGNLVVFASNQKLSKRADAMKPATLRRHLAALVKGGFLTRRDSPNGKRYARKGPDGEIVHAFGFDLRPLVARMREFEAVALAARKNEVDLAIARETLSLLRRDVAKMIQSGIDAAIPHDWVRERERYDQLSREIPRRGDLAALEALSARFSQAAEEIRNLLKKHENARQMSTSGAQNEHHKENSKQNNLESESSFERQEKTPAAPLEPAKAPLPGYSLGFVLEACPDFAAYIRPGSLDWNGFADAAAIARPMLGISPDAYARAQRAMGRLPAAAAVAAILQRMDQIRSPGGYLRTLTNKAERGEFSLAPILMALRNRRPSQPARTFADPLQTLRGKAFRPFRQS